MVLRQVLLDRRRKQVRRLPIHRYEVDRHVAYSRRGKLGPIVSQCQTDKSDRLLVVGDAENLCFSDDIFDVGHDHNPGQDRVRM
ncbi:hypothetical protein D779_0245 [Imhoffiella purpurea]|uniref:Uncharacterized protein n=1 Tax=Imhoffiella purpurea TaxID=1249627 RepID=W9UUY1_9GAMM|nr:hypothetical protein D779_0245 [Imhoffiella purpurea]